MNQDEIKEVFDKQAASYDTQWARTAPIRNCLHLLLDSLFAGLPKRAKVLCVGVGTGDELFYLAQHNPDWTFTAVEPSGAMLAICRERAEEEGLTSRCHFHEGYLESLPDAGPHDAATCFLVSQFILDPQERSQFFKGIADRLKPNALLANSDLASDIKSPEYEVLLRAWMNMMSTAELTPKALEGMRKAYANDVGVIAPEKVAAIIEKGGFAPPVQFYQAGLIHAWRSQRM